MGVNPAGAVLLYSKKATKSGPIWWNVEIIYFSDGAWKRAYIVNVNCGIGGILVDSKKKVMFSFSRNSKDHCHLEDVKNAMLFLYTQFKLSPYNKQVLQLYMDSVLLVQAFLKARAEANLESLIFNGEEWNNLVKEPSIKISYVNRDHLLGADELAKKGRNMDRVISAWC